MTSARTIARSPTQCPYCDHVSPEESKFCNECGAALHLKPCPHCGSLNDITKTEACLRCGGMLAQAANDSLIVVERTSENLPAPAAPPELPPPRRGRPLAATALVALGGLGLAGYYYGAPPPLQPAPPPAPAPAPMPMPVAKPASPAPAPAAAPLILKTVEAPSPTPAPAPPMRPAPRPPPRGDSSAIEPKTPPLGPCTAAVAALGLCTEAPNNKDRRP